MKKYYTQLSLALPLALLLLIIPHSTTDAIEINPSKNPMERLKQGNHRYTTSTTVCHEDWATKRAALLQNQLPFAIVISCSDSRVPPEIIFDQTLGDLFVVRLAGNVVDDFAMGTIEYGVNVLGAKFILVLGHSNCGAVSAAMKGLKFDNHIQTILTAIEPAVNATKGEPGNPLENSIKMNVRNIEEKLRKSQPVLAALIDNGTVHIAGGYYDLESGHVEFLED